MVRLHANGLGDQLPRADGTSAAFWSTFGADGAGEGAHAATPRRGPKAPAVVALLVLAAVVGTGFGVLTTHHSGPSTPNTATAALPSEPDGASSTAPAPAPTVDAAPRGSPVPVLSTTSYDPSGGSGFVTVAPGSYETQHYATAAFGGLKPGVGLLLDLGQARTVSAVDVTSAAAGTRGGLIGLDAPPPAGSAPAGAAPVDLNGTAQLTPAPDGPHRYWLLFVTRLGNDSQGRYYARLSDMRALS